MRFGHFNEVQANPERNLFDANSRVLKNEISPSDINKMAKDVYRLIAKRRQQQEVNQMTDSTVSKIETVEPDFDLPEDLRKEGIHIC